MAPTRAFTTPISSGERLTAAQLNALDDGQYAALVRNGAAALTADSEATLGSYHLKFKAASTGRVKFEDAWPEASGTLATVTAYAPPCVWVPEDSSKWSPKGDYWETTDATASHIILHMTLPVGLTVTSLTVYLMNPLAAGLPGTMPSITPRERNVASTSSTTFGPTSDTTAVLATYQALHAVTHTFGTARVIEATKVYSVRVTNETTAAGLQVYRPTVAGTLAAIRTV